MRTMDDEKMELMVSERVPLTVPDGPGLPALPETNIGMLTLTRDERAILDRPSELDRFAVQPTPQPNGTATVYLPHEFYRDRLREAVGFGAFALKTLRVWTEQGAKEDE